MNPELSVSNVLKTCSQKPSAEPEIHKIILLILFEKFVRKVLHQTCYFRKSHSCLVDISTEIEYFFSSFLSFSFRFDYLMGRNPCRLWWIAPSSNDLLGSLAKMKPINIFNLVFKAEIFPKIRSREDVRRKAFARPTSRSLFLNKFMSRVWGMENGFRLYEVESLLWFRLCATYP